MQKLLAVVLTVAAFVGASTAQETCSEQCLDMVEKARSEQDPFKWIEQFTVVLNAGCESCYAYHFTSTTAAPAEDEGGSARTNTKSHSRKSAGHLSRLAAAHRRNNHH